MTVVDRLLGQVLADAYRLTHRVAIGSVGMVYEAEDVRRPRRLAVKLLHPTMSRDPGALEAYRREARTAGGLGHPHIAEFVDFSPPDAKGAFVVTELLEGEDLSAHLGRVRRLSVRTAVTITRELLAALAAAHLVNVTHRDVHPRNVFLCRVGARRDHVKLLDFGVANLRTAATGDATPARIQGSARYLSPEQVRGETLDARVDVWAAGTLLYEMLAGSSAFAGPDRATILARITEQEPAALHNVRSEVRPELEAVIARALAKSPADRFASAQEMRDALAAAARLSGDWADEAPVALPPESFPPAPAMKGADPFTDSRTVPFEPAPATLAAARPPAGPPPLPASAASDRALTDPFANVRTVPQPFEGEAGASSPAGAPPPAPAAPAALVPPESTMELSFDDIESVDGPPPLPQAGSAPPVLPSTAGGPPPLPVAAVPAPDPFTVATTAQPLVPREKLEPRGALEPSGEFSFAQPWWRRPPVLIGGGIAAVLLLVVIVVVSASGRKHHPAAAAGHDAGAGAPIVTLAARTADAAAAPAPAPPASQAVAADAGAIVALAAAPAVASGEPAAPAPPAPPAPLAHDDAAAPAPPPAPEPAAAAAPTPPPAEAAPPTPPPAEAAPPTPPAAAAAAPPTPKPAAAVPAPRPPRRQPPAAGARRPPRPAPPEEHAGHLTRDQVRRVMAPLGRQVKACFRNFNVKKGTASFSLTVAPSGHVTRAAAVGRFAGTPAGGCAATAVRHAKFPSFHGAATTISYGYSLR